MSVQEAKAREARRGQGVRKINRRVKMERQPTVPQAVNCQAEKNSLVMATRSWSVTLVGVARMRDSCLLKGE